MKKEKKNLKKAAAILLSAGIAFSSSPWMMIQATEEAAPSAEETAPELTDVARLGTPWGETCGKNHDAALMTDGNASTFWMASSTALPVSAGVHLDKTYEIQKIRLLFENRASTDEIMGYTVEVKDPQTREWVQVLEGTNYNPDSENWDNVFVLEQPVSAYEIRVTFNRLENTLAWPAIWEMEVYADTSTAAPRPADDPYIENLARNKPVLQASGSHPERITDGISSNYWDGGPAPSSFVVDLETGCLIQSIKAITYYGDSRYYHYSIQASMDGKNYTTVAIKDDNSLSTSAGNTFEFEEPVHARYIRVSMTKNSANPSVHMNELFVYGSPDPEYVAPAPEEPLEDPDNLALNKTIRVGYSKSEAGSLVDGDLTTEFKTIYSPTSFDLDLEENVELQDVVLHLPAALVTVDGEEQPGAYYWYSVYGSTDGENFTRLYEKLDNTPASEDGDVLDLSGSTARYLRFYMKHASNSVTPSIQEIRVHGNPTGENVSAQRTGAIDDVMGIDAFEDSEYADPITEAETIENVYGIIDRTVGEAYRSWFDLELLPAAENGNDYFELSMKDGKVHIGANSGLSLAVGLNHYYKNYAGVHISEQERQTVMPASIVEVEGTVRQETPMEIRYANNYCTLDYTFAFFGEEEFQKEYDWMALNGINLVLDLAGQEAVWIKFLQNFGYSVDDGKDWLCGPSYYAWQFMDNMENYGGPISDDWVRGRLEMARKNQRWKRSLGMQTVMQGYAGMVPENFNDFQPDVTILEQGTWGGVTRPPMIRTDSELFDEYSRLFFAAQEWALGDTSDYYGVDPFHEGGIRPKDLTDDTISAEVMNSLLEYNPDAVWVVQHWQSNPTKLLLEGMGENRKDHCLILDLDSHSAAAWNRTSYGSTTLSAKEFEGTDWVWCTLINFGGNSSMHGNLQKMADDIWYARQNAQFMKGVGCISEGSYDNPVLYDLLFDCIWSDEKVDVSQWIHNYVKARYGKESEKANEAWSKMLTSIYGQWIGYGWHFEAMTGDSSSYVNYTYSLDQVKEILRLLMEDFDSLKDSQGYLYDLMDVMKTAVNMYSLEKQEQLREDFAFQDLKAFEKSSQEMLDLFDLADAICATQKDYMVGEWIGRADDWAADMDDWSKDSLPINAKLLITEWNSNGLTDYVHRTYAGLLKDVYKPQKQNTYEFMKKQLAGEEDLSSSAPAIKDALYWNWIYQRQNYSRTPDKSDANFRSLADQVLNLQPCAETRDNLCLKKPATASRADFNYIPANAVDGNASTYWDAGPYSNKPWLVIDLEQPMEVDKASVSNVWSWGSRYYQYELYGSLDNENWVKIGEKLSETDATKAGDGFRFSDGINIRYLKVVGLYNSANTSFHVSEVSAYGNDRISGLNALLEEAASALEGASEGKAAAIAEAMESAEALKNNVQATNTLFDEAEAALRNAMEEEQPAANKVLLEMAVSHALQLKEQNALEGVNALVVQHFEEALAQAQTVLADEKASQDEVNAAWSSLVQAIQMLGFTTDFSELDLLLARAESVDLDTIPDGDLKDELLAAMDYAKEVRGSDTALTEVSIAEAVNRLQAALDALDEYLQIDLSILQLLTESVQDTDLSLYLSAGQAEFTAALEQAQAVLAAPESQQQVDEAALALHQAWLNLRLKADESLVESLRDSLQTLQVMSLNQMFAQSSQKEADVLIHNLETLLEKPEISDQEARELQSQVDEFLKNAKDPQGSPVDPSLVPEPSDKAPAQSIKTPDASSVQNSSSAQTAKSVKTAASTLADWMGLASAGSLLGLSLLLKRRSRKQK